MLSGNGDTLNQTSNDLITGDACGLCLKGDNQSVSETIEDYLLHIVWAHVVSAFNPRVSPRTAIERNGSPRTGAVLQLVGEFRVVETWISGGDDQLDDVLLDRWRHVDI